MTKMPVKKGNSLYDRVRQILDSARSTVARSVNSTQVAATWLIGQEIVEEEQKGKARAGYGEALLLDLSTRLTRNCERGWSVRQLEYARSFYLMYGDLLGGLKTNAVRSFSGEPVNSNALRSNSPMQLSTMI